MFCGVTQKVKVTLEKILGVFHNHQQASVSKICCHYTNFTPTRIIKVKTGEMTAEKREEGKTVADSCLVWKATFRHVTIWSDPSVKAICPSEQTFTYSCSQT